MPRRSKAAVGSTTPVLPSRARPFLMRSGAREARGASETKAKRQATSQLGRTAQNPGLLGPTTIPTPSHPTRGPGRAGGEKEHHLVEPARNHDNGDATTIDGDAYVITMNRSFQPEHSTITSMLAVVVSRVVVVLVGVVVAASGFCRTRGRRSSRRGRSHPAAAAGHAAGTGTRGGRACGR